eukprot:3188371-Rhodomonas_salina.1
MPFLRLISAGAKLPDPRDSTSEVCQRVTADFQLRVAAGEKRQNRRKNTKTKCQHPPLPPKHLALFVKAGVNLLSWLRLCEESRDAPVLLDPCSLSDMPAPIPETH